MRLFLLAAANLFISLVLYLLHASVPVSDPQVDGMLTVAGIVTLVTGIVFIWTSFVFALDKKVSKVIEKNLASRDQ